MKQEDMGSTKEIISLSFATKGIFGPSIPPLLGEITMQPFLQNWLRFV